MKEIPAKEAKNRFGLFLDAAQRVPVRVTKNGRAVGVMMSVNPLRASSWSRVGAPGDDYGRLGCGGRRERLDRGWAHDASSG